MSKRRSLSRPGPARLATPYSMLLLLHGLIASSWAAEVSISNAKTLSMGVVRGTENEALASVSSSRKASSLHGNSRKHQQNRREGALTQSEEDLSQLNGNTKIDAYQVFLLGSRYSNMQFSRHLQDGSSGCTLCYDGSSIANPFVESVRLPPFTCGDLSVLVESSSEFTDMECLNYQTVGATDCGCPTSPLDDEYCPLCEGFDVSPLVIPDSYMDLPIPTTATQPVEGLTCADLVFQAQASAQIPCDRVATYQRYCGCGRNTPAPIRPTTPVPTSLPATSAPNNDGNMNFSCYFCPDKDPPQFSDRKLPYLNTAPTPQSNTLPYNEQVTPGAITTCGYLAESARTSSMDEEECFDAIYPPVTLDAQSYCGCSETIAEDLCSICPAGSPLVNPDLAVPGAGGMSCLEIEVYLRFVTDEEACNTIAESARTVCCTPAPECPVCQNSVFTYNRNKLYPPFGLTCSQLNLALNPLLGYNVTCAGIQETFGYYCECANAVRPSCSLCPMDDIPPDPSLEIPVLGPGITCGEINEYASLRLEESCADDIAGWSVDAQAFCGCTGFEARGMCSVQCPSDLLLDPDALVPDSLGVSVNDFITCRELVDFAPYVNDPALCSAMQQSVLGCCAPASMTASVSVAEQRIFRGDGSAGEQHVFRDDGSIVYFFGNSHEIEESDQSPSSPKETSSIAPPLEASLDTHTNAATSDVYEREFIKSPYYVDVRSSAPAFTSVTGIAVISLLFALLPYGE